MGVRKNSMKKIKRALISVSNKTELNKILKILKKYKIEIISSGGTHKEIKKLGFKCLEVSNYTGSPEILDGRVKTLHPKIHAGILSKRKNKSHKKDLLKNDFKEIDLIIVNFYPFEETLNQTKNHKKIIENIDIGGPTMVRAAAKNYNDVTVITSSNQYEELIDELNKNKGATSLKFREQMASKAFGLTAYYDSIISNWFNNQLGIKFPEKYTIPGKILENLRYGENPHQKASLYGISNNLNLDLMHFGFRWWHLFKAKDNFLKKGLNLDKFDLIIDIQSKIRNTLILKRIPTKHFYSSTFNYFFCSFKKNYSNYENVNQRTISNLEKFYETKIEKINYNLNLIDEKYINEAIKLLPEKNYIGFSLTHGNPLRKKHWPIDKFVELAEKIKNKGKKPVFFVEKKNHEIVSKIKSEIPNAFFPEHDSPLASPTLITALTSRLEKAITIDNGIMHMMSLAQIPMIVLFGPTKPEKFAPDQENINIIDNPNKINAICLKKK